MAKIRDLLAKGYTNTAANTLYDALYYLLKTKTVQTDLTKAEFDELMPLLVAKIKAKSDPGEKTPWPGDDVVVQPAKAKLVITFSGPEGLTVPGTYVFAYPVGQNFEFEVPQIEGYVTELTKVVGVMGYHDVIVPIEYKEIPQEAVEPLYGTLEKKTDNAGSGRGFASHNGSPVAQWVAGGEYYLDTYFPESVDTQKVAKPVVEDVEKWWPGATVVAPESLTDIEKFKVVRARLLDTKTGEWRYFYLKNVLTESETDCKAYLWAPVTPMELDAPNSEDGYKYLYQIDWNGDNYFEQSIVVGASVECTLYDEKDGRMMWPIE